MTGLAYECNCAYLGSIGMAPCLYCEKMCTNCDGTGKAVNTREFKGIIDKDLLDRVFLGEIDESKAIVYQKLRNAECETCQGEGYIDD